MVKCADCGFLASRNFITRQLEETEQITRGKGERPYYLREGMGQIVHEPPICFKGVVNLWAEAGIENPSNDDYAARQGICSAIQKERDCNQFTEWRQGSTPKEHQEMIDREARLKWQAEREDADRKWRDDQRREDRRWHIIELVVFGVLSVLIAGGFTILGALISR